MREATNGTYPRIAIWENVVGAFSSNGGADFEAVLEEMVDIGSHHTEWSVLDAQFFGVPQRRRRVFVIAVLDPAIANGCGSQILSVGQSRRRNPKKGKQEGQNPANDVAGCLRSGGDGGVPSSRGEHLIVEQQTPFASSSFANYSEGFGTIKAAGGDLGGGSETLVTFQSSDH
jgi:DNA (cytosine-5)-methyltransferase 1